MKIYSVVYRSYDMDEVMCECGASGGSNVPNVPNWECASFLSVEDALTYANEQIEDFMYVYPDEEESGVHYSGESVEITHGEYENGISKTIMVDETGYKLELTIVESEL